MSELELLNNEYLEEVKRAYIIAGLKELNSVMIPRKPELIQDVTPKRVKHIEIIYEA